MGASWLWETSLARVISQTTKYKFVVINAVSSGVAEIKRAVEEAGNLLLNPSGKCILFIDEIHRFNKLQQDALLPFVENGTVILIEPQPKIHILRSIRL